MARERFIDANLLIRHFTGDNAVQSPAATALLARIERGEEAAWTTHLVIAEVVWVLTGRTYGASRGDVEAMLAHFVAASGLRIPDPDALVEGLGLWATSRLSFIDAVHVALVRRAPNPELYSWDREFDRVAGVTRLEP